MVVDNSHAIDLQQNNSCDAIRDSFGSIASNIPERRIKPRFDCDYQAIVKGINHQGNAYKENAKLVNLSAGGLYIWVNRDIGHNSTLSVTVLLSSTLIDTDTSKLVTKGIVVRTKPQANGTCGVAVKFSHYRFI
jgi:hypothetical protein